MTPSPILRDAEGRGYWHSPPPALKLMPEWRRFCGGSLCRIEAEAPPEDVAKDAPKIDRIRPGAPPRVRMPRPIRKPPGGEPSG